MENTRQDESLENRIDHEVKVDNVILDGENVTLRSKLFASLKTKISYVYNKLMNLVGCTANGVDNITNIEKVTENEQHEQPLLAEQSNVEIEKQHEQPLLVEEPMVLVEPVIVEDPVSIEERM